ncbi:MAG: ABC transporter ATP-binding protein [Fimbriimonadaceae bacterium]|nr:ABC transporter ATP-binding protein [Fimbriimonadaceae bacterium]
MRSFRRTLEFLRPYRWRMVFAVVLTLTVTLLQIIPPRMFQLAIDSAIQPALSARAQLKEIEAEAAKAPPSVTAPTGARNPDGTQEPNKATPREIAKLKKTIEKDAPSMLWLIAGFLIVVIAARNLLSYLLHYSLTWVGHRFCFDLRFATWRHLHRLSLAYHNQTQVGKIMSRVTADIELIQSLIQGQLVTFISDLVTIVAVLAMLFTLQWKLALIILGLVPFYVLSYLFFLKHIREVSNEQRRLWDEMLGKLAEKIAGIGVVKAFVKEKYETRNFMTTVREKFAVDMRQVHLNRRLGLVSGTISALGTGVVYAYGGSLVQHGQMTTGVLVAITFYIGYIFNPAVRVVDFNNSLQWAVTAMDRVFQTLDTKPEIQDKPDAPALAPITSGVRFDNVSFSYIEGVAAVHELNFTVGAGEIIGIVGPTGAGKTTLMNLLMRFYDPQHGRVLIDGTDLRDVRLESIRRQVSMVAQENLLFSVSIMENVKYGKRDAQDEEAIAACQIADLHDFIVGLPDGYETKIGEGGIKLSGGQKQRLALARALITNPSILILDDVTSALDGETEARVQGSLKKAMQGRTTFIISHRLSSVVEADRIFVVDGGRIVDIGTHHELAHRGGIYQQIYEEQFKSALQMRG